jgi:hypothetical protein
MNRVGPIQRLLPQSVAVLQVPPSGWWGRLLTRKARSSSAQTCRHPGGLLQLRITSDSMSLISETSIAGYTGDSMKTIAVVIALALLTLGFFWDVIIGDNCLIDYNPCLCDPWRSYAQEVEYPRRSLSADSFLQYYPFSAYLNESIRSGRFPLWNPTILAGMPFFADPQTRAAYPFRLILVLADPARAMGYDVAIHIFLAMVGMYLFLSSLRLKTLGSVLGAFAYAFSSYFYVRYGHPTLIGSAAWMPFFFYSFETALRRERLGTLLLTGSFAMGYLAGFPQVFLFGVLALVVYGFYLAIDRPSPDRWPALLRTGRIIGVSGVLSVLLVSIQLLPFLEFFRNSVGLHYDFAYIEKFLLIPPVIMLRSIFPAFFGQPTRGTDWSGLTREAIHPYNPEYAVYCGIGALLVALVSLFILRRSPRMRVLVLLLVLGVIVAVNQHAARMGHALLPMFRASRVSRVAVIPCFSLAALAAIGFSAISGNVGPGGRRRVIVAVALVLGLALLFAVYFHFSGESIVESLVEKARKIPDGVWQDRHMSVRSEIVREWARGDAAEWLTYERRALTQGLLIIVVTSAILILWIAPAWAKPRHKTPIALLYVGIVMFDLVGTARTYRVSQYPGCASETSGIRILRQALGEQGRWRTKPFRPRVGDLLPFPPNTNQLFDVHSLKGSHTINTESIDLFRKAYVKSKEEIADSEHRIRTIGTGITWLANRLDDLMSVRYVVAERGESRYAGSSILRSIVDEDMASERLRMHNLDGVSALALNLESGETIGFKAIFLPVDLLYFSVGFDSQGGALGDSVFFLITCEGGTGRVSSESGFDQQLDRGKWHEIGLDISSIGHRMVDVTLSVEGSNPRSRIVGRWSGFEFAIRECPVAQSGDSHVISLDGPGQSLSMMLDSSAREVPLDIDYGDGSTTKRLFSFPPGIRSRRVRIDLARPHGDRLVVRSDSTLRIARCRQIPREWGIDLDCQLIYDGDMCIYENPRAVSKGICLDRRGVPVRSATKSEVLELAGLEDIHSVECGECRILSYRPEEILVGVQSDRHCYLVFQDMYYPGWKAYVNGGETALTATDIRIRALALPPGSHRVIMAFRPWSFTAGIVLTCLGVVLTLAYAVGFGRVAGRYRKGLNRQEASRAMGPESLRSSWE